MNPRRELIDSLNKGENKLDLFKYGESFRS